MKLPPESVALAIAHCPRLLCNPLDKSAWRESLQRARSYQRFANSRRRVGIAEGSKIVDTWRKSEGAVNLASFLGALRKQMPADMRAQFLPEPAAIGPSLLFVFELVTC
jgi:hypothetical protein